MSNFLLARYELALKDFEEALLYLRGNQAMYYLPSSFLAVTIAYASPQKLRTTRSQVQALFRRGFVQQRAIVDLSRPYTGRSSGHAGSEKGQGYYEHNVIDDAIQDRGEGYTVFSIVSRNIFNLLPMLNDTILACRRIIPSLGKEDQELGHEGLYG